MRNNNIPGMEYLLRVGTLYNNVVTKQADEMQTAWSAIKNGTYKYQDACRVWATAVEDYYGLAVDVSRGPGYISRPAWLYFEYSKTNPSTLSYPARLDRSESPATDLNTTDFANLDKGNGPSFLLASDLYQQHEVSGEQVKIVLNDKYLANAPPAPSLNGQYISFVFGKNRGPEPPLVIVVLRLTDWP